MAVAAEEQPFQMPPLVIDDYNWKTSKTDASVRERRVNGAEAIVGDKQLNAAGSLDLYLISSVRFANASLTLSQLKAKLERVLVKLRFEHPEIGQTVLWEEDHVLPLIQYKPLKSSEDALAWARKLVRVRASTQTGFDIRTETEVKRHQEGGINPALPIDIDIVAPVSGLDAALGLVDVEFVFHSNHLYVDGISKRMLVNDIFSYLGDEISASSTGELPVFKWGEEVQNLGAPVLTLLKAGIQLCGPSFDEATRKHLENAIKGMQNYGPNAKEGHGLPRTIFHTFTKEESDAIYKAVKTKVGPSASPAHLGHAAVFLSLLKSSPPSDDTPDTQVYVSQSPVNGRRFLENPQKHAKTYYPVTQSTCPVLYGNIKQYEIANASKEMWDEYLLTATKIAKETYDQRLANPAALPISINFHNLIGFLQASGTLPQSSMTAPMFTSDGVNETYIQREINDKAGNIVITVNTVRFFLSQHMTFMSIRLDSWRGRSALSLSYNDGTYTDEEASEFLKDTVSFMLQFTQ
ncbi:hypothetical protein UA08_01099 [Talaromyces atroroseus]|uniref:15-O-acetyltransferase Tri3 n=1 Tax=Talaromyces atroroseus TaxID=1441469 RepID=A0A225B6Q9_TALAT|nr:hypothetical protein UA08_01099 [Talaromyces atroroseus]OKL63819.1 hypothetical protein UA08_01099 [Talaromyces atroroseus]